MATPQPTDPFHGFGKATLRFLEELAKSNERPWFEANKHRYEEQVLEPSLAFIAAMAPRIERISKHLLAVPKRTGGSLMRVYRDTRFSRNQLPYKTNIGIQFRHERGKDVHAPGFYVHIDPGGCFLGAGIWRPEPSTLAAIRAQILDQPKLWQQARDGKRFREHFTLGGEQLQRLPRGLPADALHSDDLRRKDFIAVCDLALSEVMAPDFDRHATERFSTATPLMSFLCGALELKF